jgi:hypothetical protein
MGMVGEVVGEGRGFFDGIKGTRGFSDLRYGQVLSNSLGTKPKEARLSNPSLHLPPHLHYDCVQCGRGCADFWEIPVDEASERRLVSHDLKPHQQRLKDSPPIVPSAFDSGKALCRENDVCTFLTEGKTCALHTALGPKVKPQACIDFPFRTVETPGGAYVGLSFACTAVLRDHGRPIEEHRDELTEELPRSVHRLNAQKPVHLSQRLTITFGAYLLLEEALDSILALDAVPLSARLASMAQFLDVVLEAFRAARLSGESPVELSVEEQLAAQTATDEAIMQALRRRFESDRWGRLLAKALRERPQPAQHRAFIGLIASYRQALWRGATRRSALVYLVGHFIRSAFFLRSVQLKPLESRMTPRDVRRHWPEDRPGSERDRLLTRFFRHALFRKDLLLAKTLRTGLQFMLMQYALVNWYTVAWAMETEAGRAPENLHQEALRTVEKYYGNHSRFTSFLESQPLLSAMLESMMNNRKYPYSMVAAPFAKEDD